MVNAPTVSLQQVLEIFGDPFEAVKAVSRCTRALLLAHFDTARKRWPERFEGATENSVREHLAACGVSDSTWDTYRALWRTFTEKWEAEVRKSRHDRQPKETGTSGSQKDDVWAPRLRFEKGVYNILGGRSRLGKYAVTRPAVWTTVRWLLEGAIVGSESRQAVADNTVGGLGDDVAPALFFVNPHRLAGPDEQRGHHVVHLQRREAIAGHIAQLTAVGPDCELFIVCVQPTFFEEVPN
jgi:hypothetical protein